MWDIDVFYVSLDLLLIKQSRCRWFERRWHSYDVPITHSVRATHICVSKLTIIVSGNGLASGWRQAITWTNAGILSIGPLETNFSEIFFNRNFHIFIQENAFENVVKKLADILSLPQCDNAWFSEMPGRRPQYGICSQLCHGGGHTVRCCHYLNQLKWSYKKCINEMVWYWYGSIMLFCFILWRFTGRNSVLINGWLVEAGWRIYASLNWVIIGS